MYRRHTRQHHTQQHHTWRHPADRRHARRHSTSSSFMPGNTTTTAVTPSADGSTPNRWLEGNGPRGQDYDRRFSALEASGAAVHGEADLVSWLAPAPAPASVLDAGCGTGRVAIELDRRGMTVTGVDLDPSMLDAARTKAPQLHWVEGDLATIDLGRRYDLCVAAGNVMIFLTPGTEAGVVARLAAHLKPGGLLAAGFQIGGGRYGLDCYDAACAAAGLTLEQRWATWERAPWRPGCDYAVSVHRRARSRDGAEHPFGGETGEPALGIEPPPR
jgi:SAM-dependent methyltransferase